MVKDVSTCAGLALKRPVNSSLSLHSAVENLIAKLRLAELKQKGSVFGFQAESKEAQYVNIHPRTKSDMQSFEKLYQNVSIVFFFFFPRNVKPVGRVICF